MAVPAVVDKPALFGLAGIHRERRLIIVGGGMRGSIDAAEMVLVVSHFADEDIWLARP